MNSSFELVSRALIAAVCLALNACSGVAIFEANDQSSTMAPRMSEGEQMDRSQTSPHELPFALTTKQLLNWSPSGPLAMVENRSTVELATRIGAFNEGFDPAASKELRVLYAPDGMNNFGNYLTPRDRFNLYTFTQWSGIDLLNWFASDRVSIPARPWVDAAHRNGVKILGTVFFAPLVYGGSSDAVAEFLVRDADGAFPAADQLIAVAAYYGFDGWLINQETDIPDLAGKPGGPEDMHAFMKYLTAKAPEGMEIHWYDSMLMSGDVDWQNELNEENLSFLQDTSDDVPTADAIFLNYWWSGDMIESSAGVAEDAQRSRYDVFAGADLWPQRKQQNAYENKTWPDLIFPEDTPKGLASIALFAPNFMYNFGGDENRAAFSLFEKDSRDVYRFYREQNRFFNGDDLNAAKRDGSTGEDWFGLSAYVPMRSPVIGAAFKTSFNTGHGKARYADGRKIGGAWHNMSEQDVMPTWQFAWIGKADVNAFFDFEDAYSGGASLSVEAQDVDPEVFALPLYRSTLTVEASTHLSFTFKVAKGSLAPAICLLTKNGDKILLSAPHNVETGDEAWRRVRHPLGAYAGEEISRIDVCVAPSEARRAKFRLGEIDFGR